MAEEDEDLSLKPADAGLLFRAEVALTHFFLGYWRHLLVAVVLGLLTALGVGQYQGWRVRTERHASAVVADAMDALGAPLIVVAQRVAMADPAAPDAAKLKETAAAVHAAADGVRGTGRVAGFLQAAELYRLAGDLAGRRKSLEAAGDGEGPLGYAVVSGLAAVDLAEAKVDDALARFDAAGASDDTFVAQQALYDKAATLESLGRTADAKAAWEAFVARWPEASRAAEVRERLARIGAG